MRTTAGRKILRCNFESEHKCKSSFLIFVIDRLFVQVRKTNLHLKVGRSRLEAKFKCNKISSLRKDLIKTKISSICKT